MPSTPQRSAQIFPLAGTISPKLAEELASGRGKYSRWTILLDAGTLEALLLAIGEFGERWGTASRLTGLPLVPQFYPHSMDERRMRDALETMARIQSSTGMNSPEFSLGFSSPLLSEQVPAFSREFRDRLANGAHTAWAQDLDERRLGALLWIVAEYGIRVSPFGGPNRSEYPPPNFDAEPAVTQPMRAALRLIVRLYRGEPMTAAEVSRRIKDPDCPPAAPRTDQRE